MPIALPELTIPVDFPKILHQTWKTHEMPEPIARCVESMQQLNPGWEHRFTTDADWPAAMAGHHIIDWETLQRFPTGILKADTFRAIALYENGGVYADADLLALRPLDSLLHAAVESGLVAADTEMLLTTDHPVHSHTLYSNAEILMNHFMVAKPKARFLKIYLEYLHSRVKDGFHGDTEPVSATGPSAMTRLIVDHGGVEELKIAVIPYFWIHPLPDMNLKFGGKETFDQILMDGSWKERYCPYLVHGWWHGYLSENNTFRMYGKQIFGPSYETV
jgi:Glycosyltransferase sugar-binding region containing DXD motif